MLYHKFSICAFILHKQIIYKISANQEGKAPSIVAIGHTHTHYLATKSVFFYPKLMPFYTVAITLVQQLLLLSHPRKHLARLLHVKQIALSSSTLQKFIKGTSNYVLWLLQIKLGALYEAVKPT